MIARGFKSVIWVAAVGGAALGCYMLSLQVATERAELAKVEGRIIAAKQEIRALQTELGTRGRLSQLERWNAEVLALSAPASAQFMQSEMTLARFDRAEPELDDRAATVVMASAGTDEAKASEKPVPRIVQTAAPAAEPAALVHRASYAPAPPRPAPSAELPPAKPASEARPAPRLDAKLADEIHAAARDEKVEKTEGSGGR